MGFLSSAVFLCEARNRLGESTNPQLKEMRVWAWLRGMGENRPENEGVRRASYEIEFHFV